MVSKNRLLTEEIKLNGVQVSISHSPKFRVPKVVNTELRAVNNRALRKLASEAIKF